ncbi:hypothetical protein [Paraburkholderia unamae]|uniref:Uncharacterized protein n=1 Tax=Paraburkholderia unamae TaxID=219649 RepID=A0ABX5KAL9_9BURK|nr:hypothetical protein [Paraburkholderia unamae]PVX70950.1 hypothetical protein C7402_13223 [Paraburkholderia unamae]
MCAICNFKIEFGIGHPMALCVATATRGAIDSGLLTEDKTEGVLATARQRLAAIETLKVFQDRLETSVAIDELLALPDFYVLLIEGETWGFFHATAEGFDPDIVPEMPDLATEDVEKRSVVLVVANVTLQALLAGRVDLQSALDDNLLLIDAPAQHSEKLRGVIGKSLAVCDNCEAPPV